MWKRLLVLSICVWMSVTRACAVENPILNPSFEYLFGFGWTSYQFSPPGGGTPALPTVGTFGTIGSDFNLLPPYDFSDGVYVCGMESSAGVSKNGGICQSFTWTSGKADLSVKVRSCSGNPNNPNQCYVRVGLAPGVTANRNDVTQWEMSPQSTAWTTLTLPVPENTSAHTLFIESYQPASSMDIMSTLWDDVRFTPYVKISNLHVAVPGDVNRPDTTARVTWTTNLPCTARVDYKSETGPWRFVDLPALNWNHNVLLQNLQPGATYVYRVTSANPGCVTAVEGDYTFDLPIHISDIAANVAGFDVTVTWKTDIASESWVDIGLDDNYGRREGSAGLTTDHSVLITGLNDMVTYHYRVSAKAPNYSTVYSPDQSVYIPAVPVAGLRNGSFEEPHGGQNPSLYPWGLFTYNPPQDNPIDGLIGPYPQNGTDSWCADVVGIKAFDGSYFLGAESRLVYKNGGAFQQVYNDSAGICCFAARFASYQSDDAGLYDTRVNIGMDPNGGADPNAASVIWWSGLSPTNDNKWYPAGVAAYVPQGIVTVFLATRQQYSLDARAIAFDDAVLGTPPTMSIGALRNSVRTPGARLDSKVVTYIEPNYLTYEEKAYKKIYIQESGVPAGIAVLLGPIIDVENPPDLPILGDKITVNGALAPLGKEVLVMGYIWSVEHIAPPVVLPAPLAMSQRSIGGAAFNQQSLTKPGVCNLGVRLRLFGKVTWPASGSGGDVYLDDGAGLYDASANPPAKGIRVRLAQSGEKVFAEGDYMTATGVLTIQNIGSFSNPKYAYMLVTNGPDDWSLVISTP
ncbi:MAG: fibronectin type III domain-containing protein [Armatimonadetes bacterium]|nr:fibronectin type III domain-containing protein [Armatimonadota bacterium]